MHYFQKIKHILFLSKSFNKRGYAAILFLVFVASFLEFIAMVTIGPIVEFLLKGGDELAIDYVFKIITIDAEKGILIFVFFFSLVTFASLLLNFFLTKIAYSTGSNISSYLFKNNIKPISSSDIELRKDTSINAIILESDRFSEGVVLPSIQMVSRSILLVLLFIMGMYLSPFGVLSLIVLIYIMYLLVFKKISSISKYKGFQVSKIQKNRLNCVSEVIDGRGEVLSFKLQQYFTDKFKNLNASLAKVKTIIVFLTVIPRYLIEWVALVGAVLILWVFENELELAIFASLGYLGVRLLPHIQTIYFCITKIKSNLSVIESFDHLLTSDKYLTTSTNLEGDMSQIYEPLFNVEIINKVGDKIDDCKDFLKIRKLNFSKNIIIKILALDVPLCGIIGVAGPSGCGKSTLIRIISGEIQTSLKSLSLYAGNYEKQWDPFNTSIVAQHPFIFSETPLWNITFQKKLSNVDQDRLINILKVCTLESLFLCKNEEKISDDIILTRYFSGGESSRIALARALYSNKTFILLDEVSGSWDINTEKKIFSRLLKFIESDNRIVIMSAHREQAISVCHSLIVFKKI